MNSFGFRPHFSQTLNLALEEAQAKIIRRVERCDDRCELKNFPGFICLRIPEQDRHFWSPRLNLSLDETEDGKTCVNGIYGPNANVWSLFLYGYLITGMLGLFSAVLGYVQWELNISTWGLWVFGAMLTAVVGLYILAQFGQKLGATQSYRLHQIYESAMGSAADIR